MSLLATKRLATGIKGLNSGTTQLEKAIAAKFITLVGLRTSDKN
jgi:X-X-X-Leu-X-X-Gly heptad repeat protein